MELLRCSHGSSYAGLQPPLFYNHYLLPADHCDRVDVVLVSPRNPLNIGAAARAMANFGFSRLAVVAPYEAHWREARSAVGAPTLLENATECATLPEAVAACSLVIGSGTLTYRKPEQPVIPLPQLPARVTPELSSGGRIAVVFGPEKHGLTRDDLSYCHAMVEIPTDPRQPSMNLGQAVAVCLYELATHSAVSGSPGPEQGKGRTASSSRLDLLAGIIDEVMSAADYSPQIMRQVNLHDLRTLLRRLTLSEKDTRRILGVFRRILWQLKRCPPEGGKNT